MGNLKFNGKSTEELGLVIQTPPSYTFPERDMSSVHVPGRNGDLYIDNKCYQNAERSYAIAKGFKPGTKLYANAQEILSWLTSANGKYVRLEDSYDNEVYRLAMFNNSNSFVNYFDEATSIDVTFKCKPQRFLKSGENTLHYEGSSVIIENITGYESLPSIELINVPSEVEDVLMMTVTDSENQNVSNVTLSHVGQDQPENVVVVIDSEEQTINRKFPDKTTNVAPYVGLNGLPFPSLRKGKTRIELKKYESENSGLIKSYESFMNEKCEKIDALYKPVMRIANEKEKTILVRSWETMVNEAKKNNIKEAYQTYILANAEDFTLESVNNALDSSGESTMEFTGALSENNLPNYDFVEIGADESSGNYRARVKKAGYFMVKGINSWKTLKYYDASESDWNLFTGVENKNVIQIIWYPEKGIESCTDSEETPFGSKWLRSINVETGVIGDTIIPKKDQIYIIKDQDGSYLNKRYVWNGSSYVESEKDNTGNYKHEIKIDYGEDIPDWLTIVVESGEYPDYSPQKVLFKTSLNTGYYYIPKSSGILSGLFSKARWMHNNGTSIELNKMAWDNSKKAFVSSESALSKKTDVSYNFKYLPEIIQYKKDDSEQELFFSIYDKTAQGAEKGLTIMGLRALKDGWYVLMRGDESDSLNYSYHFGPIEDPETGTITYDEIGDISGTENFKVSYIPGDPSRTYQEGGKTIHRPLITYANEKGWPEWLDPHPLSVTISEGVAYYNDFNINATAITFKILEKYDSEENPKGYLDKKYMYFGANDTGERNVLRFTDPAHIEREPEDIYIIQNGPSEPGGSNELLHAKTDYSFYVYQIDKTPVAFNPLDRSFIINDDVENEMDWDLFNDEDTFLSATLIGDEPAYEGDEDLRQISYRAKKSGFFRWNTNSAWVWKDANDEDNNGLLMTSLKDDTTIYYLEDLPEYEKTDFPDYDEETGESSMFNKIELIPQPQDHSNPTSLLIKVKDGQDGYYKINNIVDWKRYISGETIAVSKVNETNQIFHLIPKNDLLDNMEINIIPRWWML